MSVIISIGLTLLSAWLGFNTSDTYYQGICHGGAIVGIAIGVYSLLAKMDIQLWHLAVGVIGLVIGYQQLTKPSSVVPLLVNQGKNRKLIPWRNELAGTAVEAFTEGDSIGPNGQESTCDLPSELRMRNTGGMGPQGPGSGAGLCVFTSAEHAARWQQEEKMYGFQKKMMHEQGGGYPQKFDAMAAKYCNGAEYVQHTGGSEKFLELALKTGRMPSVTYAGNDSRYNGLIAHMVNLVHLDETSAAILDNNFPAKYLWMSREEFLERWRERGGGWAVVLLASPPPPVPHN